MNDEVTIKVPFAKLISALSLALDLAETKKWEHARRTTYFSLRISKELKISKQDLINVYYGALLHDISKVSLHQDQSQLHPEKGAEIVTSLPFLEPIGNAIRYHHERWDGKGFPHKLVGEEIPLASRIIFLADQVENNFNGEYASSQRCLEVENFIAQGIGNKFDPTVAQAALSALSQADFWPTLGFPTIKGVIDQEDPLQEVYLDYSRLEQVAEVFAKLIDSKSPFTYQHSEHLAKIAVQMGKVVGFSEFKLNLLHVGGRLHDIGKMVVPNHILDKPGKLTAEEFSIIQQHPYYTERILNEAEGLGPIVSWACQHHEKLDGSGYHRGEHVLSLESQIIAFADIYQALVADRPYRQGMQPEQALQIIRGLCDKGQMNTELLPVISAAVI